MSPSRTPTLVQSIPTKVVNGITFTKAAAEPWTLGHIARWHAKPPLEVVLACSRDEEKWWARVVSEAAFTGAAPTPEQALAFLADELTRKCGFIQREAEERVRNIHFVIATLKGEGRSNVPT